MAALAFFVGSALEHLWDFAGAFVRYGYSPRRGFQYLRAKSRETQFRQLCLEVWLQELSNRYELPIDSVRKLVERQRIRQAAAASAKIIRERARAQLHSSNMQRPGIDFAAIEATNMAYEAIDSFAARESAHDVANNGNQDDLDYVENFDDIEVITPDEINTTFYEYVDALPVYQNSEIGTLCEGRSFTFTGYILPNCERMSINFVIENENRDVALHINPRLPQNYIVRNTKVKGIWGREEVSSALPFSLQRGAKFAIQVLVTSKSYMLSVNGNHFAMYNHRLPYTAVATIEVKGDVDQVALDIEDVNKYPDRLPQTEAMPIGMDLTDDDDDLPEHQNDKLSLTVRKTSQDEVDRSFIPREWRVIQLSNRVHLQSLPEVGLSLPYYGVLPANKLRVGRCLKIVGRVKLLPHSFYINLQQGQHFWPHPLIAFHFNPRFSKHSGAIGKAIVCRNAWYKGDWGIEERSELDTDFRPGKTFCLFIDCAISGFEVYLNGKFITQFKYQLDPTIVDTVYVQGDIKLWAVELQGYKTFPYCKNVYENPHELTTDSLI